MGVLERLLRHELRAVRHGAGRQGLAPHQDGQVGPAPGRCRLRMEKIQRPEGQRGRDRRLRGQDEAHLGGREGRGCCQGQQGTAHHFGQGSGTKGSRQLLKRLKKCFMEMTCRYEKTTKIAYKPIFFNALYFYHESAKTISKSTHHHTTSVQSVKTFREHFVYNQCTTFLTLSDVMLGLDLETGVSKGSDVPRRTI